MIILLSPSKTMSKREAPPFKATIPAHIEDSQRLVETVRKLDSKLGKTLGVSEKIAELNRGRYAEWSVDAHSSAKPTLYAFASDVYNGLAAFDMNEQQVAFAQQHLRILSGLYGLLKPSDAIMPHRLEMSTRLAGEWGKNLYEFWGDNLADEIMESKPSFILNCASDEYFKSVAKHLPSSIEVVTPRFLHDSGNGPRAKMTFAKYTRGLMARWAIENQISNAEETLMFNAEGYEYHPELSEPGKPVFIAPKEFSLKGRFIKF